MYTEWEGNEELSIAAREVDSISRPDNNGEVAEKYKVRFDQTATESAANFLRKLITLGVTGVRYTKDLAGKKNSACARISIRG